jgi:hypothetical protein
VNKTLKIVAGSLAVLIVVRVGIGLQDHRSDKQQITDELQRSIQASKEGRPGSVFEMLSDKVKFNEQDASENMGQVADFIKQQKPDIQVENPDPIVTGDTAAITTPVDMTFSLLGISKTLRYKDVVLVFRREPVIHFLVFPGTDWKLTDVKVDAPLQAGSFQ